MTEESVGLHGPPVRVVRGRKDVLKWKAELVELTYRCGQAGDAIARLEEDFARPSFTSKRPTLVLTTGCGANGAEELQAAVLLYEHRIFGVGCRVFYADYQGAVRTVIAPEGERARAALAASELLLQQGALLVHVSYEGDEPRLGGARSDMAGGRGPTWAMRRRQTIGYMPVDDTAEATLANLGKHTRRNLRYYRRRAEADLGQMVVDHPEFTRDEFVAFSRVCSYPLAEEEAVNRHEAMQHQPSSYLYLGLRAANGEWLSLIGGRHEGNSTYIEWQMNRADMPSYSLCTLMRSHLIDYEVARGSRRVYFVGGTGHSISSALIPEVKIADLLVIQFGLPRWALRRVARPDSFVREMLSNTALQWHPWQSIPLVPVARRSVRPGLNDSSPANR